LSAPEIQLGKYMVARLVETRPKTVVYGVFAIHHGERLGTIKWFEPWRQYCYFCLDADVFSSRCFKALTSFLDSLNQAKRGEVQR
jgi:hypothetical protein